MSDPTDPPAAPPPGDNGFPDPPPPPLPPPPPATQAPYGQPYGQQQYAGQQYQGQQQYGAPPRQGNGPAVAGLVLGILAVLFAFVPFLGVLLGILFGVLAAIFGGVGLSRSKDPQRGGKGMGIAGIVLGIVGVVLSLLQGALLGAVGGAFMEDNPGFIEDIQQQIEQEGGLTS